MIEKVSNGYGKKGDEVGMGRSHICQLRIQID
jgi:hypothetical protein